MNERLQPRLVVLAIGVLMAAVLLVGLVIPASVFEYREAIARATPMQDLYSRGPVMVTFGLLVGLYIAALVVANRPEARVPWREAFAVGVVLCALSIIAYPSGSRDIFKNISDSRTLWLYGENPTSVAPNVAPDDPLLDSLTLATWRREPGFYGIVSYVAYGPPALVGGDTPLGNMLAFKAYHALVLLAMAGVAALSMPASPRAWSTIFVAWNPLLLFEGVVSAHNDLLMAALFLGAVVLIGRRWVVPGAALFAASVGVKIATVFAAPVAYVWLLRGSAGRVRLAMLALGAAGIMGTAGYVHFVGLPEVGLLIETRPFFTPYSLIDLALRPHYGADTARTITQALCVALLAVVFAVTLWRTRAVRSSLYVGTFWVLVASAALAVVYAWPWYFVWFIPIAALLPSTREAETAIAFTAAGLASYAIVAWPQGVEYANTIVTVVLYGLPLLYAGLSVVGRKSEAVEPAAVNQQGVK